MIKEILYSFKEALQRGEVQYVSYTKHDKEIVRKGITSIQKVLLGKDMGRKRSLLFCLDWFMDPYYGQDISGIEDELINLLQVLVITHNDIDVKEDALQLLEDYAWGPFTILEDHFNDISNKVWILHNINLAEEENKPDDIEMHWLVESGTIGKLIPYPGRNFSEIDDNVFLLILKCTSIFFLKRREYFWYTILESD